MGDLSVSEILFYSGIAGMGTAAVLAVLAIAVFAVTGRRLKKKLEQDYGKPRC